LDGATKKNGVGSKILPRVHVMARIQSVEMDVDQNNQPFSRHNQDHEAREKELDEKYTYAILDFTNLNADSLDTQIDPTITPRLCHFMSSFKISLIL
jgi:hypothetical protein